MRPQPESAASPDFLAAYLRQAPAFMALVRGVECRLLRSLGPLAAPVLDLGCGDGLFAALAFPQPVDFGIDPSAKSLREARARRAHRCLLQADATSLPFPRDFFGTIVCNSVLEHIPDVERAVAECTRTLRPGGRLAITAPSHRFGELLLGSALPRRLGLKGAARAYARWFNGHSHHDHTDSCEVWAERLRRHGLTVQSSCTYLTAAAHRAFDLAHYLSVPRLICYRLTGRWTLTAEPLSNRIFDPWLRPHYENYHALAEGPYIFADARKADATK